MTFLGDLLYVINSVLITALLLMLLIRFPDLFKRRK